MKTHELKTWPVFYKSIIDGTKTFEVRQNDRDFQLGDLLLLREYDPDAEQYTGAKTERVITYILGDNPFFQLNNMVILGISPLPQQEPERTAEKLDFLQYVTNLLYNALEQGFKLRHFAGIGEGFRNADTTEFDKWVEEQTELLAQYYQFKLLPVPSVTITDEEIEKQFPTDVKTLSESLKYPSTFVVLNLIEENRMAQQGAKWALSQLPVKESIQSNSDKIIEKQAELIKKYHKLTYLTGKGFASSEEFIRANVVLRSEIERLESELSSLQSKETIK